MEFKESVHGKFNDSFSLGGVLRYQGRLCVPDVDRFKYRILEEAHVSRYSIHPGSTKMYLELTEIYWWEGMKKDIVTTRKYPLEVRDNPRFVARTTCSFGVLYKTFNYHSFHKT